MDTPGVEVVKKALEPLCGSLHEIFSTATARSERARISMDLTDSVYNSMGTDVTRALVHRALNERGDIGGWTLTGKHNLRGQVLLRSGLMRIRFLHERAGAIPAPGHNYARRAYYRNVPFGQLKVFDAESSNLVAVWRVTDPELSEVAIRVVRPIDDTARWNGAATEVDLDFTLPNLSDELADLEFVQADQGLWIDLDEEDEGEGEEGDEGEASASDVR